MTTPKSGVATIDFKNLKYTSRDIWLSIMVTLIAFGDAVEIYLPGVITQSASKDLGVSETQEGILGIILYLSLAVSSFLLPYVETKMSSKTALLISLYTSILSTAFCAAVPNYWTLLGSRVLLGMSIGLNMSTGLYYFTKEVSSYDVYNLGSLAGMLGFSAGGGWVAVLGYLLLTKIGWRYFILSTSMPVFIPPIFLLHFVLRDPDMKDRVLLNPILAKEQQSESEDEVEVIRVDNFRARLLKACMANFINTLQGWGSILLIPSLLDYLCTKGSNLTIDEELLILALLYGGAKSIGKIASIFLLRNFSFRPLQATLSILIAVSYLIIAIKMDNLVYIMPAMAVANMCFCVTKTELSLMEFDKHFFGTERLTLAGGSTSGSAMMGAAVGATIAAFLNPRIAVTITFVLSCIQVGIFLAITER